MKNYILIICCLFVLFTITPSLSKNLVKTNTLYETVCNQTVANDYESSVDWWGVSGALLPILILTPEAIPLEIVGTILGSLAGTLSGISGSYSGNGVDYSDKVMKCFKRMVHDEINDSLLQQATMAIAQTGDDTQGLNEQLLAGHPPEETMEKMKTYYERIVANQRTVGQLYNAIGIQKTADKQSESMLHYYLNMLTVQSFTALSISVYAFANFEHSQFESEIEIYFKDVRNFLDEQFNSEDETQGIQNIFDKSAMATTWLSSIVEEKQGCGGETGFASCHYDKNFCYVHDSYRNDLKLHSCGVDEIKDCSVWDHWDPCVAECDESQCTPEHLTNAQKVVEDTLTGVRTSITDARKVVEGVVIRIENMLFTKKINE